MMDIVKRRRLYYTLLVGGGLSPASILGSSLLAWFDASDADTTFQDSGATTPATANNDPVGAWQDKSGNGYHATQATTANKPTLKTATLNSKNTLSYDGADFLNNTSFPDFGDNYSVFIVAKYDVSSDVDQGVVDISTGTTNTGFLLYHTTTANFRALDSITTKTISGSDVRDGTWRVHTGLNTGSQLQYWLNSTSQGTIGYTAPNPNTLTQLAIGRLANSASFSLIGSIAEVIIANATVTDEQRADMWAYLNNKWAVY